MCTIPLFCYKHVQHFANLDVISGKQTIKHGLALPLCQAYGFPLNVFRVLYESCVCAIADYGSAVLGFSEIQATEKFTSELSEPF